MTIELNHTIVPAHDKIASATFFARIFGLVFDEKGIGYFAPVCVNEALTLDFEDDEVGNFDIHHYAFKVDKEEFDKIFGRVQTEGIPYGSGPTSREDMTINHRGGRAACTLATRTGTFLNSSPWGRERQSKGYILDASCILP